MAVPPAPVRVPSQRPLATSVTSVANDKGDNEMILGTVHRSPGICLTAEENPRKLQLGDRLPRLWIHCPSDPASIITMLIVATQIMHDFG